MQGRLQLALSAMSDEEKSIIGQQTPLPEMNWDVAEAKLRESIERNPNFIDGYNTLSYLLLKCKKYADARAMVEKGLTIDRITKWDDVIAKELENLKSRFH